MDQAWYWTPEWQAKEREADRQVAEGRVTRFLSEDEFLASFDMDFLYFKDVWYFLKKYNFDFKYLREMVALLQGDHPNRVEFEAYVRSNHLTCCTNATEDAYKFLAPGERDKPFGDPMTQKELDDRAYYYSQVLLSGLTQADMRNRDLMNSISERAYRLASMAGNPCQKKAPAE